MKKLLIISLVVLGLGIVSCQKQEITPISGEVELPVWEQNTRGGSDIDNDDDDGVIGEITDPNDENDDPITDDENADKTGNENTGNNSEEGGI